MVSWLREVGILIVILVVIGGGAYALGQMDGRSDVQVLWDADRAKLMQANDELIAQHADEIKRIRAEQDSINKKVNDEHLHALKVKDDALAAARADATRRGGLRIEATCPASGGVGTATEAQGSSQHNETVTTSVELPQRVQDGLWAIIGRAEEVTEQARSCQNWIKANGFAQEIVDEPAPSQ